MSFLIYLISFLEGFTTLSVEIIAIRRFTPIIGTNSISTSIILGVILLALSYGYYIGGKNTKNLESKDLIKKIIFNLTVAGTYYLFFTFIFDQLILSYLILYIQSYFFAILLSSFLLFFIPVFLASQTIPLLSEVLKGENTGEKVGKLLFFSTVGSFLGSVMTSSVLFPFIGVYKSSIFDSFLLTFSSVILIGYILKKYKEINFVSILSIIIFFLSIILIIKPDSLSKNSLFKIANSYHDIEIYDTNENTRIFSMNGGYSSGIDKTTKESFFNYIKEIKKNISENKGKNLKILIIGGAGFTLPKELSEKENIDLIDVVDVDPNLKDISEKYFLQEKLSKKVNFIVEPSRYFLNNAIKNNKFYDEIVIDIYVGKSLPSQTLTEEFFKNIKKIGKNININIISDLELKTDFSKNLFNTMQKAFGKLYFKSELDENREGNYLTNIVVSNNYFPDYSQYTFDKNFGIYTDNKNSIEIDVFKRGL
ncbi:hypothetical protein BLD25_04165 [Candidatus Gracilibacteria bacterium GN02-872]|nr:hypothetical protein BLD25_04165 [Candidatus Gracilibacteria bacterium GN02-872]RKW25188.1 MAG: hypothetical protein D8B46_00095 [Candidatus Gracilibacteria bacterium]